MSTLQSLIAKVDTQMELYQLYNVVPAVLAFIDDLTNWYIRSSRRRFWRPADSDDARADKANAYATLYEVLVTFSMVAAPFLPFITEAIYQNLVVQPGCADDGLDSIHLCRWPEIDATMIDVELERQVAITRQVVRLGRRLRERHKLKTRQPLGEMIVVHHDVTVREAVVAHTSTLSDELNVQTVTVRPRGGELATVTCKANFKRLGRRFGKRMREAAAAVETFTETEFEVLDGGGTVDVLGEALDAEDVVIRREPGSDAVVIETEGALMVAYDTHLTDALVHEGMAREVVSWLQRQRKEAGFAVVDRIRVTLTTDDTALAAAIGEHTETITREVLADTLTVTSGVGAEALQTVRGTHLVSGDLQRA